MPVPNPLPSTASDHRVEFDWRGEAAYYVEHSRRVMLACMYWGGPAGRVFHIDGVWEYGANRQERLTNSERATVLQRVIQQAKQQHGIMLEVEGE